MRCGCPDNSNSTEIFGSREMGRIKDFFYNMEEYKDSDNLWLMVGVTWLWHDRRWISVIPEAYIETPSSDTLLVALNDISLIMSACDASNPVGHEMWKAKSKLCRAKTLRLIKESGRSSWKSDYTSSLHSCFRTWMMPDRRKADEADKHSWYLIYDMMDTSRALVFQSRLSLMRYAESTRSGLNYATVNADEVEDANSNIPWMTAWQSFVHSEFSSESVQVADMKRGKMHSLEVQNQIWKLVLAGDLSMTCLRGFMDDPRRMVFDENDHFIVQKLVMIASEDLLKWMCQKLSGEAIYMSKSKYACRVLCRMISQSFCSESVKSFLLEFQNHLESLASDAFGNYVVQDLIEYYPDYPGLEGLLESAVEAIATSKSKANPLCIIQRAVELRRMSYRLKEKLMGNLQILEASEKLRPKSITLLNKLMDLETNCHFWKLHLEEDSSEDGCILEYVIEERHMGQLKRGMAALQIQGDKIFAGCSWALIVEKTESSSCNFRGVLMLKCIPYLGMQQRLRIFKVMRGSNLMKTHDFGKRQLCVLSEDFTWRDDEDIVRIGLILEVP